MDDSYSAGMGQPELVRELGANTRWFLPLFWIKVFRSVAAAGRPAGGTCGIGIGTCIFSGVLELVRARWRCVPSRSTLLPFARSVAHLSSPPADRAPHPACPPSIRGSPLILVQAHHLCRPNCRRRHPLRTLGQGRRYRRTLLHPQPRGGEGVR
jgi:hypothetical protein